ncbi:glycosyltransferase family 4 protein [bacterium]|nr:glycosyltransferase family 4 protein [bacterium]
MRICYLANVQSIHTQRWARHFQGQGYQVSVISFEPGVIGGVKVVQIPHITSWRRLNILLHLGSIRRLVRDIAPDILHAHYVTSYGLAGSLAGIRPLVVTAWGTDVLITPEESWVYRQIVRFALSRADLITSMAQHMTDHLVKRGYASSDKIVTLPFGIDTEVFNPDRRTRLHGDKPDLVVSTRHLDSGMDVDTFVRAIPKVLNSCSNLRFIIVSDGPLQEQLKHLTISLGIADNVEFRGHISHQEMPALLGQADVFVTTSPSDGNNISLNEAMACGAFPVATDIPANRAWIEHRRNGLMFPCRGASQLADAIIEALHRPEWRQAVMSQNWEIVRTKASWSKSMHEMDHHYARLLQKKLA